MQYNFEGISISSDNDELSNGSVEGLCRFVGSLLDLLE